MAIGKMTPRQKMINMMYLVLLAMLALNVSPEVLDAFEHIKGKLQGAALEAQANAADFIGNMKKTIQDEIKNEGKITNEGLLDTLDQIQHRTSQLTALLDIHRQKMEDIAQFDFEKHTYTHKDELEKNYQYWMGEDEMANDRRGNGEAEKLRDSLNSYFSWLTKIYNSQLLDESKKINVPLIEDPEEDPKDPNKRWEQYTFEGPVISNLATIEALKIDIHQQQNKLLELLNERLGVYIFVPDRVTAISAPVSRIVPAGLPFQTQLFVGMSSSQIHPKFNSPHGHIQVEDGGNTALLNVIADGSRIPTGKTEGTQTYTATIQVPKATGGFETLNISETFTVRKPEVVIQSEALQILYRNCGNIVNIDVPALGEYYNPVVEATDADIRQSENSKKRFIIVPRARNSVVSVKSRTQGQLIKIDDLKYQVIAPPRPEIDFRVNNRAYNGTGIVPKSSRFKVRLNPNQEFKRLLPNDAKYRISKIDVLLKDRMGPPRKVASFNVSGQNALNYIDIRMPAAVRQAPAGSKVFVQLEGVQRVNFQGRGEDLNIGELERTIGVELR